MARATLRSSGSSRSTLAPVLTASAPWPPLVAAGLAERCEVQLSYAIGVADPTSIMVETFGTGKIPDQRLTQIVRAHFDLTPFGLREMLDLARPIYQKTAAYGHFGRKEEEFSWERTDKADLLAAELKASRAA